MVLGTLYTVNLHDPPKLSLMHLTHRLEWEAPSVALSHMLYKLGLPQKNNMISTIGLVQSMLNLEQVL